MSTHFTDLLDEALARQINDEQLSTILADYPIQAEILRPLLKAAQSLTAVNEVVFPDALAQAADRGAFLTQLEQLPAPVSHSPFGRLKGWMVQRFPRLSPKQTIWRKVPKRLNSLAFKAVFVLLVVLGSIGGTAVFAAESLPDSPIYPLKLVMEDVRLALTNEADGKAALHISLAEERVEEILALVDDGRSPDEAAQLRLENHINATLNIAAQQPDESLRPLLIQVQNMVQTYLQHMANYESESAQLMLGETNGFLFRAGQEIEQGLQNPQLFRAHYGNNPAGRVPADGGPCHTGNCDFPGSQNQYGHDPENSGHNGLCEAEDCLPAGDQNQYGLNPDNDSHNGPSADTCASEDCNQYQHQNEGMPLEPHRYQHHTGDGSCNNGDCEPGDNDVHHGEGNNGNLGDGNNGDGNNGIGNGDGNNGNSNNGVGNNGGTGGNGGN